MATSIATGASVTTQFCPIYSPSPMPPVYGGGPQPPVSGGGNEQQELQLLQQMMQLLEEFMGGQGGGQGVGQGGGQGGHGENGEQEYQEGFQAGFEQGLHEHQGPICAQPMAAQAGGAQSNCMIYNPEMNDPEYREGFQAGEALGRQDSGQVGNSGGGGCGGGGGGIWSNVLNTGNPALQAAERNYGAWNRVEAQTL